MSTPILLHRKLRVVNKFARGKFSQGSKTDHPIPESGLGLHGGGLARAAAQEPGPPHHCPPGEGCRPACGDTHPLPRGCEGSSNETGRQDPRSQGSGQTGPLGLGSEAGPQGFSQMRRPGCREGQNQAVFSQGDEKAGHTPPEAQGSESLRDLRGLGPASEETQAAWGHCKESPA